MATADVQSAVPSHMRTVPGSVNIHIAQYPSPAAAAPATDPTKVASDLVGTFNQALEKNDFATLAGLFVENGYWRDHLALTWAFRTARSPPAILDYLQSSARSRDGFRLKKIVVDDSSAVRAPKLGPIDVAGEVVGVQFFIILETAVGTGTGVVKLAQEGGQWKIFTLYTRLDQIRGHEEAINGRRGQGVQHGGQPGRKNWAERRQADAEYTSTEPTVFIVGRSQTNMDTKS